MIGKKFDYMQTGKVGALIAASALLVSFIFSKIGVVTTELFSAFPSVSVVTATVGEKTLGLLSGILPISDMWGFGILALFISSILMVLFGEYAIDNVKLPYLKKVPGIKPNTTRLFSVIIYGAIVPYVLLVGLVAPQAMTFLGIAIHTFATAFIAVIVAGLLNFKI